MRTATVLLALAVVAGAGGAARRPRGSTNGRSRCAPGPGTVSVDGRKPWGLAGGLDVEYGLTDAWAVRASFEASTHDVSKASDMDTRPAGTLRTDAALIGLTYTFDVLRLVPYAELQAGLAPARRRGRPPRRRCWRCSWASGADYFVSRRFLAGLAFHYLFEPADLLSRSAEPGNEPVLVHRDRARFLGFLNAATAAAWPPRFFWAWARNTSRTGVPSKP